MDSSRRRKLNRRPRFRSRKALAPLFIKILVVGVALFIGTSVVCKVLRPIRLANNEHREMSQIVTEYKSLHKQNEDLRRQLRYLQTSQGIAHEARKQGFVKPGEISLVISDQDQNSNSNH